MYFMETQNLILVDSTLLPFIDDYSHKLWAYVLKTKDQVLSVFKEFHMRAERETDRKLKVFQEDNGGEYLGSFEE